jgi:hypothetical protein
MGRSNKLNARILAATYVENWVFFIGTLLAMRATALSYTSQIIHSKICAYVMPRGCSGRRE